MDKLSYLEKNQERTEEGIKEITEAIRDIAKDINQLKTTIKLDQQKSEAYDDHIKKHDSIIDKALQTEPCKTTAYKLFKDNLDKKEIKEKIHFINIEKSSVKKVALVSGFLVTIAGIVITALIKKWF